jgi:hypothetical protein
MFKMIFLILGLLVGFGGGVYWAHHNPDQAAQLSAAEEKKFLEYQLALTQKIQAKLEQLSNKTAAKPAGASGFLGAGQAPAVSQSDVNDVKAEAQKQQDELQKRLAQLK